MFEYGHLKCIELSEAKFTWYFITIQDENYIEAKLEEKDMLKVLNKLGQDGWELAAIDELIGFILKRGI